MTDEEAIGRVLAGEAEAFRVLVQKYQGPVYRIAVHLALDRHEAEDAAQEAFVSAFLHLRDFNPARGSFPAWLFATAKNRALDGRRKRWPRAQDLPAAAATGPSPETAAESGELSERLDRALESLPIEQRAAFVLHEIAGMSSEEIAAIEECERQIKRVVGLPGDEVELTADGLLLNGELLEVTSGGPVTASARPELQGEVLVERNGDARYRVLSSGKPEAGDGKAPRLLKLTVPHGHCFVLGDNRDRSLDSRDYGPVPMAGLIGRVDKVIYPRVEGLVP